jgi:hypothetical protein
MKSQGESRNDSGRPAAPPSGRRAMVAALITVVVLVALLLWVAQSILAHNRLQNCIDSGRRDCVPVDTGAS